MKKYLSFTVLFYVCVVLSGISAELTTIEEGEKAVKAVIATNYKGDAASTIQKTLDKIINSKTLTNTEKLKKLNLFIELANRSITRTMISNDLKKVYELTKEKKDSFCKISFKKWELASEVLGASEATQLLAYCYYNGIAVNKDLTKAIKLFQKSAEQQQQEFRDKLLNMHNITIDETVTVNKIEETEEVKALKKAAEEGDVQAQYDLAERYDSGNGIEYNSQKAVEWWKKAAENGHQEAKYTLGRSYQYGWNGIKKDPKRAFEIYKELAELGNKKGQYRLGKCYQKHIGCEKNYELAVKWYRQSAEQGYKVAQFRLAMCYSHGIGVEKNNEESVYWFREAALQGYPWAQCNLAIAYERGRGVKRNMDEAIYWYQEGAKGGSTWAQNTIGCYYNRGLYLEKDKKKAVYWWTKAAKQGYRVAQSNLAFCYQDGIGVEKDTKKRYTGIKKLQNKDINLRKII
jgi:TPR repeat protein